MEEQNNLEAKPTNGFKKYWWVFPSAILVAVGVAGITYLSLMQTQKPKVATNTNQTSQASTEVQQIETEQQNVNNELSSIEKDLNNLSSSSDAALDTAPQL